MRIALAAAAAAVVVVMVLAGVFLRPPQGGVVLFRTSDRLAMIGLGLLLGAGLLFLGRCRVDADSDGIRVLNIVVHHDLPWTAVKAVRFDRKSAWASLLLENDDEVAILALQIVDGERTVAAIEALRALHAAARPAPPPGPPLLHET
jgi:hypothetical protein